MGLISGILKKLTIAKEVKIYFQRYPGTDAASGIAGVPCKFWVRGDKEVREGETAKDGSISLRLKKGQVGVLSIFGTIYQISVRTSVEGIDKVKGQQRRLAMLGYGPGPLDGILGAKTDRAILNFQADNNPLDTQGTMDAKTRDALKKAAGV